MASAETGGPYGAPARRPRAKGRWLAWLVPVLAVVALIAVKAGLQAGNGGGSAYTIPEVDSLPVAKAVALIKARKLVPRAVGFPCLTQFMQAGLVMGSLPPSGEGISEAATVELYVCTGMGLPVPQVADLPLSNAIQQLGEYGFRYTIRYAPAAAAEGIPTGVVSKQNPQAESTYTFGGAR